MTDNILLLTLKARGDRAIGALDRRTRTARVCGDAIVLRAHLALQSLAALPPARLTVALYGVVLVEAYVVATIILTVLTQFTYADVVGYDRPADQTGLVFLATILLPSLILAVRWLRRAAVVHEAERGESDAGVGQRAASTLDSAYHRLHLAPDAPLHVAEAAYIAAMKRAHPDVRGGSNDAAMRLTGAIDIIRASAGWRDAGGPGG